MTDEHFTKLSNRLSSRIYDSNKGQLRLELLWQSLLQGVPQIKTQKLNVLDIGGGAGHIAHRLCELGHEVTLVEPAKEMLDQARETLAHWPVTQVQFVQDDLQHFIQQNFADDSSALPPFDLVLCHAVLEWLTDPRQALKMLSQTVGRSGRLSLMFYNRHSITIRNLIKGNFYKVKMGLVDNQWGGDPGSLTPKTPLDPAQVYQWVEQAGLQRVATHGIRTFFDYMSRDLQQQRAYDDVLELEQLLCSQEPYISMSRYIHLLVKPTI